MNDKMDYYKEFWMFKKINNSYKNKENATGYVKIEIKEKLGHLSLFISHIKDDKKYKVYLIKKDKNGFKSIFMGDLLTNNNIGILSYQFNPYNVDNRGYSIIDYNVVAVVNISEFGEDVNIEPLACAYKEDEVMWQDSLKKELLEKKNLSVFCPIKRHMCCNLFNVEAFKYQMDINFRRCNPFFNERQDYIWWHIFNSCKLWQILRMFRIETQSMLVNNMILGIYENDKINQQYIVLGYLINNNYKDCFDKVVDVYSDKFKVKLKYGLKFIKPCENERAN